MNSRRLWCGAAIVACLVVNPYVRGDGNGYYAWLVSAVVDRDLDFTNQFARADPLFQTLIFDDEGRVREDARTPTGRVVNQWSAGPAVLWAPWFLAAHLATNAARFLGIDVATDGYGLPYLWVVSVGTVFYGFAALWLGGRVASHLGFGAGVGWAALGIGLASSLPVYQVFLPFHVHALSAFAVAAYLAYWVERPAMSSLGQWATWGALAGLMVQVYHVNAVLLLPSAWLWIRSARDARVPDSALRALAFAAAAAVVCVPQMIGKYVVYGDPFVTGYQDRFLWLEPRLLPTLMSTDHGWVLWTPVVALALFGLVRVWITAPSFRPVVVACVVFYVVIASYQNWHGQSSFGNRFFISLTLPLVVGLAAFVHWCKDKGPTVGRATAVALGTLIAWNAGLAFQWGTNIIPNRGPVSFTEVAVNQVTTVPQTLISFAWEYLLRRREVQQHVESDDIIERRSYEVVR